MFREGIILADFYDEINQLINDIVENKIKQQDTIIRIANLKEKYGNDIFPDLIFEPETKPWVKGYLTKLKKMSVTGAFSEQFIIHMSEVSDYVYKNKIKKLLSIFALGVVVVLIIIFYLIFVGKKNEDENVSQHTKAKIEYLCENDEENNSMHTEIKIGGMCYGNIDQC